MTTVFQSGKVKKSVGGVPLEARADMQCVPCTVY